MHVLMSWLLASSPLNQIQAPFLTWWIKTFRGPLHAGKESKSLMRSRGLQRGSATPLQAQPSKRAEVEGRSAMHQSIQVQCAVCVQHHQSAGTMG